jgi:hypothetical protein
VLVDLFQPDVTVAVKAHDSVFAADVVFGLLLYFVCFGNGVVGFVETRI